MTLLLERQYECVIDMQTSPPYYDRRKRVDLN